MAVAGGIFVLCTLHVSLLGNLFGHCVRQGADLGHLVLHFYIQMPLEADKKGMEIMFGYLIITQIFQMGNAVGEFLQEFG